MKQRITILFVIAIAVSSLAFGQKENYNWFFGNHAAITFNTPYNQPIALHASSILQNEGCASISDAKGSLLFYTDGRNVWNNKHKLMPDGIELMGSVTSTQSAMILKSPHDPSIYYIFTVDYTGVDVLNLDSIDNNGFRYSIVDMRLDKGLGDISTKNILIYKSSTEKQTSFIHKNNKEIWIIAHEFDSDRFITLKLDSSGKLTDPIFQSIGSKHNRNRTIKENYDLNGLGYMKFSPDGKKIALAIHYNGNIEIFDFDNESGIISNCISIQDISILTGPYGIEFSPDNKKLFVSGTFPPNDPVVYQFDLNYSNADSILNHAYTVFRDSSGSGLYAGAIQLGPDEKIYLSFYARRSLSSINRPNLIGQKCDFNYNAVPLSIVTNAQTAAGLPNYVNIPFKMSIKVVAGNICSGETLYLFSNLINNSPVAVYSWSGPNGFTSDLSNPVIPNADPSMSGYYKLTVTSNAEVATDSVYVMVNPKPKVDVAFKGDSIICGGNPVMLQAKSDDTTKYTLKWSTGETTDEISVSKGGNYSVVITNEFGCCDTAARTIIQSDKPKVTLSALGATSFCEGDSVVLQAKAGIGYKYQWGGDYYSENFEIRRSFPEWSTKITDPEWQNPIKPDSNEFPTRRYLGLFGNQMIKLTLGNLPLHDSVDVSFDMYVVATWDGNVNTANGPDLFRVLDLNCNTSYSSTTSFSRMDGARQAYPDRYPGGDNPKDSGAIDKLMINNEQVSFSATVYRLNYRFAHNCPTLQLGLNALLRDISSNFQNESWGIDNLKLRLNTVQPDTNVTYSWTTGETLQTITVGKTGNYQVEVMNQAGCYDTASIFIKVNPNPTPTISGRTKICQGEMTTLSVDGDYSDYQWSTGDVTKSITVEAPIKYTVIVTDSNGCTGAAEISVEKNNKPSFNIIGDSVFCSGSTVKLSADNDFESYQWESGEMTKEIRVTKGGTYKLTVTDANGCQNNAEHTLTEYKINTAGLVDLDYGTLAAGADIKKDMIYTNKSNTAINITKIYAKNAVKEFFVSTFPDLPKLLSPDSSLTISVSFRPNDYMDYADQLIVESDLPCAFTKEIAMKGTTSTMTLVWLPDTTAKIGDPGFCIPLMARREANISISEPLSFTAEIRFNATAMLPNNLNSTIIAGERVLNISADNIQLYAIDTKIYEFCGKIFLPDNSSVPLKISNFSWSKANISNEKHDGSLKIIGICQPNISRLTLLINPSFQIMENPVIDELTIQLSQSWELSESVRVDIFNVYGQDVNPSPTLPASREGVRIDVSSLPSGMYFVRIGDSVGKFVKL